MVGPSDQKERLHEDLVTVGLAGAARCLLCVIILIAAIAAIAHLLWGSAAASSTPLQRDTLNITLSDGLTQSVKAKTRITTVSQRNANAAVPVRMKQVQLPDGRWIDCHGNCTSSYMRASTY